jgi:hypothetical protein
MFTLHQKPAIQDEIGFGIEMLSFASFTTETKLFGVHSGAGFPSRWKCGTSYVKLQARVRPQLSRSTMPGYWAPIGLGRVEVLCTMGICDDV